MTSLNLSGENFCKEIGLPYHSKIMISLRELNLVSWFKIGVKYMYPREDVTKISNLLRDNKISIKTDGGYYITINTNNGLIAS